MKKKPEIRYQVFSFMNRIDLSRNTFTRMNLWTGDAWELKDGAWIKIKEETQPSPKK